MAWEGPTTLWSEDAPTPQSMGPGSRTGRIPKATPRPRPHHLWEACTLEGPSVKWGDTVAWLVPCPRAQAPEAAQSYVPSVAETGPRAAASVGLDPCLSPTHSPCRACS